jgi:plasmid stability protein
MESVDISAELHELPDKIRDALLRWRRATGKRMNTEAREFVKAKMSALEEKRPSGDDFIKSLVRSTDGWLALMDEEAAAESEYVWLYERHLANKKTAGIRTAF